MGEAYYSAYAKYSVGHESRGADMLLCDIGTELLQSIFKMNCHVQVRAMALRTGHTPRQMSDNEGVRWEKDKSTEYTDGQTSRWKG